MLAKDVVKTANCEEEHAADDHRFASHPIGNRGKRQSTEDGAQAASSENQAESAGLHGKSRAQAGRYIPDRLGIETVDKHCRSTQQEDPDLEAAKRLFINQLRNIHQCSRGSHRFVAHSRASMLASAQMLNKFEIVTHCAPRCCVEYACERHVSSLTTDRSAPMLSLLCVDQQPHRVRQQLSDEDADSRAWAAWE